MMKLTVTYTMASKEQLENNYLAVQIKKTTTKAKTVTE